MTKQQQAEYYIVRRPDDEDWANTRGIPRWQFETALVQVRSDIDDGASGYKMVDKDLKPTGEPPPDPPGAYCFNCEERIWAHNNDTAFLVKVEEKTTPPFGEMIGVGIMAACEKCSQLTDDELGGEETAVEVRQ